MKISVGKLEVLDSGVVLSPNDSSIKFELAHGEEEIIITVRFEKRTDTDEKGKPIDTSRAHLVSDSEMEIVLKGWDDSLGVAPSETWELGSIGSRKLKLQMRIHGIKTAHGTQRMFAYTWLLGDSI